jgi:hypothetical protein
MSSRLWPLFQENFNPIFNKWGNGQFAVQFVVQMAGSFLSSEADADEFKAFFSAHPIPAAALDIARTVEDIRTRAVLKKQLADFQATWSSS